MQSWGFSRWLGHEPGVWRTLVQEAEEREQTGQAHHGMLCGSDIDTAAIAMTRGNARRLGIAGLTLSQAPFHRMQRPEGPPGLLVTNPPYGERIGEEITALYTQIGDVLRQEMLGWFAGVLVPADRRSRRIGLRSTNRHMLHNGPLECRLLTFEISPEPPQGGRTWKPEPAQSD
jgi:23S rRNA (guanine2445-N2)-methyltransferase / 23S rRNA (guanine2069-N7)-methyltransferase